MSEFEGVMRSRLRMHGRRHNEIIRAVIEEEEVLPSEYHSYEGTSSLRTNTASVICLIGSVCHLFIIFDGC